MNKQHVETIKSLQQSCAALQKDLQAATESSFHHQTLEAVCQDELRCNQAKLSTLIDEAVFYSLDVIESKASSRSNQHDQLFHLKRLIGSISWRDVMTMISSKIHEMFLSCDKADLTIKGGGGGAREAECR